MTRLDGAANDCQASSRLTLAKLSCAPDLLRALVVRVVVAGGQRVSTHEHAALDLRAQAGVPRARVHAAQVTRLPARHMAWLQVAETWKQGR